MNTCARKPVVFVRGQGVWLYEESGKKRLDAVHGWAASGGLQRLATGRRPRGCPRLQTQVLRIFSITGCSRMAAMIFSSPPQFGQCSRSKSNTGLTKRAPFIN
jgi:hypothetical protein